MATEGHLTARQLSARNRGSLGEYMYTGYGQEPVKPATPTIGKSVKTYNNEDAASYARRNRGNLSDIMGQSQSYETSGLTQERPVSANKTRSKEAQDSLNRSFGDSMKLVFDHSTTPAADVLAVEEPQAPEPAAQEPSPATETASVASEAPGTPAAESPAAESPAAEEVATPAEPAPSSPAKPAPSAQFPSDSPRAEARAHALRNRGTLSQVMAGDDPVEIPVSSRGTPRGQRRPDSVADVFNYNTAPTEPPKVNSRVKSEGEANYQRHRISNIF